MLEKAKTHFIFLAAGIVLCGFSLSSIISSWARPGQTAHAYFTVFKRIFICCGAVYAYRHNGAAALFLRYLYCQPYYQFAPSHFIGHSPDRLALFASPRAALLVGRANLYPLLDSFGNFLQFINCLLLIANETSDNNEQEHVFFNVLPRKKPAALCNAGAGAQTRACLLRRRRL